MEGIMPHAPLEGYWKGAAIRTGNSVQIMELEIKQQGDSLMVASNVPEWIWIPAKESKLHVENNVLRFETYYGEAEMILDSTYMEMIGTVGNAKPPINLHLKKTLKPYRPKVERREIEIENDGAKISGWFYVPTHAKQPLACAVMVHGRGCGTRYWKSTRAKKLAEYGIAAFSYDKRGSKASGFPCEESTHDYNVSDVKKIVEVLAKQPEVDKKQVGLISSSAGGWIVPEVAAESKIPISFMITLVGPSTSVMEQQLQGGEAFAREEGYSEEAIKDGLEYTRLMFSEGNYDETYDRMMELLDSARKKGWIDWLVEDDIPDSAEAIPEMWVQRFSYDPADDLAKFKGPFLSILAEDDPVVPYKKQAKRLHNIFDQAGKTNYSIKVVAGAGHNMQHSSLVRELPTNEVLETKPYYFKFDRVAAGTYQYMVDFLDKNGFLSSEME